MNRIAVFGLGYVGLSLSLLLSRDHSVVGVDIDGKRVEELNERKASLSEEPLIGELDAADDLDIEFTRSVTDFREIDMAVIAVPTDGTRNRGRLDTSIVEEIVRKLLSERPETIVVIKSTVPVGFTKRLSEACESDEVYFVPEFLREGKSIEDSLDPSRLVVGHQKSSRNIEIVKSVFDKISDTRPEVRIMSSCEAELVKLGSNSYLATRVAFFNEIESMAVHHDALPKNVIDAISLDPRIGRGYNNPSFGFGG